MIEFSVPFDHLCSKNEKHTQRRRHTQKWVNSLEQTRASIIKQVGADFPTYEEPVFVLLQFWEPTAHRRDIHNYEECLFDAMEGSNDRFYDAGEVIDDDYHVFACFRQRMGIDRENPRVEVLVAPLSSVDIVLDVIVEDDHG